jgi:hypothetical protein
VHFKHHANPSLLPNHSVDSFPSQKGMSEARRNRVPRRWGTGRLNKALEAPWQVLSGPGPMTALFSAEPQIVDISLGISSGPSRPVRSSQPPTLSVQTSFPCDGSGPTAYAPRPLFISEMKIRDVQSNWTTAEKKITNLLQMSSCRSAVV